jgi:hypothetical protein
LLSLPVAAPAAETTENVFGLFGPELSPEQLAAAVAEADKHPLGAKENPVRVSMPPGERRYLGNLRCPTGEAPGFSRLGSTGKGPFGNILDVYTVKCPAAEPVNVYMDMYHGDPERRPVPGFTIAD